MVNVFGDAMLILGRADDMGGNLQRVRAQYLLASHGDFVTMTVSIVTTCLGRTNDLVRLTPPGLEHYTGGTKNRRSLDARLRPRFRPARSGQTSTVGATDARIGAPSCYHGDARVRAEPFDAIELELGILWSR